MYNLGRRDRRPGFWSRWLAIKALVTGLVMVAAVFVVKTTGLNAIAQQRDELGAGEPPAWLTLTIKWLIFLPLPGVLLAIGALTYKRVRVPLVVLSVVCTLVCLVLLIAALVGSLAPFYQWPADLNP